MQPRVPELNEIQKIGRNFRYRAFQIRGADLHQLQVTNRVGQVVVQEMQHFARELFLLSRQCGAADLIEESRELFSLARQASGKTRGNSWDFKLYGLLASIAGWARLGRLTCYSDSIRK